ncbi:MAG: hypothetical protein LH645_07245 [Actinomycetia bacterium]|nr:hypothetical protein [Actinomycetes bacterium]
MNGNDDFFGGSINPAPVPSPGVLRGTHIYAPPGSPAAPVKTAHTPAVPIILVVVGALLAVAAFLGYRVMTAGTDIVLPDELLGMERVDPESQVAQEVERSWSQLETYIGKDIDLQVGMYTNGAQVLIVAAAEEGVGDAAEQDDYFAGFTEGFGGSLPQAKLMEADAGSHGGRMQCIDMTSAGRTAGACTWVAKDTFGFVVLTSPETDTAEATRTVREAIER